MTPVAFPLCWPDHQPRMPKHKRGPWRGGHPTVATAYPELLNEARMAGMVDVVVSSDVPVGKNGQPLSTAEFRAADPGVCLWFRRDRNGPLLCIACDRFERPSGNMRAIALIVEGRRREERYGTQAMIESSWAAFDAQPLPQRSNAPAIVERAWFEVLGVMPNAALEQCEVMYRHLAKAAHPDAGGSTERMAELNRAIKEARAR